MKKETAKSSEGGITGKKAKAISALLSCKSMAAAAATLKVSEVTLWRWLQEEDFKKAYREARSQVVSQAIGQIQNACTEAVQTLSDVMADLEAPASARVSAAKTVLETAFKTVEIEDLEERISELEARLGEMEGGSRR